MKYRSDKKEELQAARIAKEYCIFCNKFYSHSGLLSHSRSDVHKNNVKSYTLNNENDRNRFYYRSDHYNFAKNNIPVIFYFNGIHEDYHKVTDTVEKIDFDKIQKITRLIFLTAWELANRDERIELDKIEN